jgi:hypothetical protein
VKIETSIPQGTTIAATTVTTMISITTTITTTIGSLEGGVHLAGRLSERCGYFCDRAVHGGVGERPGGEKRRSRLGGGVWS